MPPRDRILRALFLAYVAATAVHIGFVMAHEPFSFDAWNVAVDTGAKPFTIGRFFDYWRFEYTHSNPRLGQALTYLVYKLAWVAEIAMPLSYLGLSLAVTTLGLGRWPRRGRELAMWAIAIGFGWFVLPEIGRNMFCRAYGANYVFGAAVQLWFLVPLRLARSSDATTNQCIAYGLFGVVAGMCNEHTGPALLVFLAGYAGWLRRAGERPRLVIAGGLGALIGFAAIFFAPGQGQRYEGLAQKVSLPGRVIQRGVVGNLDILRDYVVFAAPLLGLILIVLITTLSADPAAADAERHAARRRALRLIALALVAGTLLAATLFASPKLGSRFYIVSLALLLAGFIALLDATIASSRLLSPFVALAVAASSYAGFRTIPLFRKVAEQGAARMAALDATTPGSIFVADAWEQVDESWWYIGDDFRDVLKRELVARYFDLGRVFFRGYDQKAPLGMLGVRVAPRYWTSGSSVARYDDTFDLGVTKGFDIPGVHRSTRASIDLLRQRIAPATLDRFELAVEFVGAPPPLPRPRLVVARWAEGRFEGYAASIVRNGRDTVRTLELPNTLAGRPFDIYLTQVGGEVRKLGTTDGKPLRYVPWRSGIYWMLACDANECWVIAATRQAG